MPASKAQQKAVTKYMKAKYDEIKVRVEKGQKNRIQSHAEAHGESVNGFIGRAISETMERDGGAVAPRTVQEGAGTAPADRVVYRVPAADTAGSPQEAAGTPAGAGVVSLPSDLLENIQRAARAADESVPDFIRRASDAQARRDSAGPSSMIVLSPELVWDATVGGFAVGETTREFVMRAVRELVDRERPDWDDETLRYEALEKMAGEKGIFCLPPGALETILGDKEA